MSSVRAEITALEERLRVAELGPDPAVFEELLADDVAVLSEKGDIVTKDKIVEAHQPGRGPRFTRVDVSNLTIVDHTTAAVATCQGEYESEDGTMTLKFLRVWLRTADGWRVVGAAVSGG